MRRALILLFAAGLASHVGAQVPDPHLVLLRPIVEDATGQVVPDLTAADFELVENGVTRAIESSRFVPPGAPAAGDGARERAAPILSADDEKRAAAEDGTRLVAMFLDEYHVSPGAATTRAREIASEIVERHLSPRDLLVVLKPFDSLTSIRLTRDRRQAAETIAEFDGRVGLYEPRNVFERAFIAASPERADATRAQISTSAIGALVTHLASVTDRRTALIVITEGFNRSGRRRDGLPSIAGIVRAAAREGVAIYPIDPNALVPVAPPTPTDSGTQEASNSGDMLQALAQGTGGDAVLSATDFSRVVTKLQRDLGGYYLLSMRAEDAPANGAFRSAELRARRPGLVIRGADGYWAPSPVDIARAESIARSLAPPPVRLPPIRVSGLIRPWFGVAPGTDGSSTVTFAWEPVPTLPGVRSRAEPPARVAVLARTSDGSVVYEGVVAPNSGDTSADVPASVAFPAPPGRLNVELAIADRTSERLDVDVRDVAVRAFGDPLALGSPAVLRAGSEREFRALLEDPKAAPVASREFGRDERLLIRIPVRAPDGPATVTASLVSGLGRTMRTLSVNAGPSSGWYQIDVPLAGLANGSYEVHVTAEGADGRATERLTFRIVG